MADFSDGFVLSMFFGGDDLGTFRSLSDSGSTITITNDDKVSEVYNYETVTIEKSIKINKTEGDTVTTTTQTFSKKIITKIFQNVTETDEDGGTSVVEKIIMETIFNAETGKISGYKDGDKKEVTFVCPQ